MGTAGGLTIAGNPKLGPHRFFQQFSTSPLESPGGAIGAVHGGSKYTCLAFIDGYNTRRCIISDGYHLVIRATPRAIRLPAELSALGVRIKAIILT